ncbi:MAG: hypothetical protein H6780_04660 [Candidatus Nomurabacteria bacterium]|nr:MAG: hypothetical protein H6780_04660 [Candidatus Nomurabacteria bacterium]
MKQRYSTHVLYLCLEHKVDTIYLAGPAVKTIMEEAGYSFYDLSSYPNPSELLIQLHTPEGGPTLEETQECLSLLRRELPRRFAPSILFLVELKPGDEKYFTDIDTAGVSYMISISNPFKR